MVAISLYRGNLHKVPNAGRQWLMPAGRISVKDFKILLRRRHRALSRIKNRRKDGILDEFGKTCDEGKDGFFEGFGKKGDKGRGFEGKDGVWGGIGDEGRELEGLKSGGNEKDGIFEGFGKNGVVNREIEVGELVEDEIFEGFGKDGFEGKALEVSKWGEDGVEKEKNGGGVEKLVVGGKRDEGDAAGRIKANDMDCERVDIGNSSLETARKEEDDSDKQKRRQEIEEKLKMLNEKKHNLVQALKQILNVEEELKRRSYIQGFASQPPVGGGQVHTTHDSGSMSRHNTPRMGSEGYVNGRRTFDATLPSRPNSGVANSPSRFAPSGHQGLPPHLPSVSVSGTNYIASSPSPAASGGTSAFRDRRSPWN